MGKKGKEWKGREGGVASLSCLAHHITQIASGSMLSLASSDIHIYEHEKFCNRSSTYSSVLLCLKQLCAVLCCLACVCHSFA